MKRIGLLAVLLVGSLLLLAACGAEGTVAGVEKHGSSTAAEAGDDPSQPASGATSADAQAKETADRPAGWTNETHGKSADPNYVVVFPDDRVNRIDLIIAPENWQVMLENMTALYGPAGNGRQPGQAGEGRPPEGQLGPVQGGEPQPPPSPPGNGQFAPAPGGAKPPQPPNLPGAGVGMGMAPGHEGQTENPVWVPATVRFEGITWIQVGIRFKGNSTLRGPWQRGSLKLPFKLDFDQFEDENPEIKNQRFYGFQQLTLANNSHDESYLRETLAADAFRAAGVAAAHTAFYQVFLDYGEGPVCLGLYTMVEVVSDTVIQVQFGDDSGNLYKPEGAGASFAAGAFSRTDFYKETNQQEADWSDIQELFQVLHSDRRLSDPAGWRARLEAVFDVDTFLRWLAANTVMQNWDTYGFAVHNYFLYHNPSNGLLTWIPWDSNEALLDAMGEGLLSLSLDEVTDRWPLIRFLMDDQEYQNRYTAYVIDVMKGPLEPRQMAERIRELSHLLRPYLTGELSGESGLSADDLDAACQKLVNHVARRAEAVQAFLEH